MNEPTADEAEELDPLEAELRSMRPAELSAALHGRVGRDLAARARAPRRRLWLAAGGLAAAACVVVAAAVALRLMDTRGPGTRGDPVVVATAPATAPGTDLPAGGDERPALADYRRALSRSPDDLVRLLDRHAARRRDTGGESFGARVTASSGVSLMP